MDALIQDVRHALRQFFRSPSFTIVAISTLALGIGATTTIFSTVRAVLIRPLPFPAPAELVQLFQDFPRGRRNAFSPPTFADIRSQNTSFTALAAINSGSMAVSGAQDAEQLVSAQVTGDFFTVLGVPAERGRVLGEVDANEGSPPVAVISHAIWLRLFGGDPGMIGRPIRLDGVSYQLVGVMPPGFGYPLGTDLWTPQVFTVSDLTTQRGAYY